MKKKRREKERRRGVWGGLLKGTKGKSVVVAQKKKY
jgi:hypothetical protein